MRGREGARGAMEQRVDGDGQRGSMGAREVMEQLVAVMC